MKMMKKNTHHSNTTMKSSKHPASTIVGMTEAEARAVMESAGYTLRVLENNGQLMVGTTEMRTNRYNVAIRDGIVIRVMGCA